MHQPFYKNLATGEYHLPWTRMHGLKDYYGMVKVLDEFPRVRQTFNLVPSLVLQLEEYARGEAADPFLRCALKPAEDLTEAEVEFVEKYFFQAEPERIIARYPRYRQLRASISRARRLLGIQDLRDLQVLSQLAWFDEEFTGRDPEVKELAAKGRDYTPADQALMGRKQLEILGAVMPAYRQAAARGQIEISTTPFYHPILPLVCDSDIGAVSHPHLPLPARFRYPEDARCQLERAREFTEMHTGVTPAGLWPSEGSVSDEALALAADTGFEWFATDNSVLSRTLGRVAGPLETYRPYLWQRDGRVLRGIFRDHYLSDLVGFVYARMSAEQAAGHFLDRIRENCAGRESLVPIILDGENAWEYYLENGRPFLRELYRRISDDPQMEALTVSEALERGEPEPLKSVFPGSWIGANFNVWIGAEEDNKAWECLLRARQAYERAAPDSTQAQRTLAYEELLIAEGSDWCWWYGPEHDSANRPEFDQLYRIHLANAYRALGLAPPEELSRPILHAEAREVRERPLAAIRPEIDGEVTSYFEWLGAGVVRADSRGGAMHGERFPLHALFYGSDGEALFLRLDFDEEIDPERLEVRVKSASHEVRLTGDGFVYRHVLEARVPLQHLGCAPGGEVRFQVSLWEDGLPRDAIPRHGWIEFRASVASEWEE